VGDLRAEATKRATISCDEKREHEKTKQDLDEAHRNPLMH
jgi:hypothetical protein